MSKASAIIRIPGGRRAKWAVLVFWLVIVAVAGPLADKLTGAEKNDSSGLAFRQGRVDPGGGPSVEVPVPQYIHRPSWSMTARPA